MLQIYLFVLLIANAMARPRVSSEKLMELLWRDGLIFFLVSAYIHDYGALVLIVDIAKLQDNTQ